MRSLIRDLVVAWADKIKAERSERRKTRERERVEAQNYIIEKITGGECIHAEGKKRLVYCDDCPIGDFNGELSHGASEWVCTRRRHYSK